MADALFRVIETISLHTVIDFSELDRKQENDSELQQVKQNKSLHVTRIQPLNSSSKIYCDISTVIARRYIPPQLRITIFDSYHNLSHPGKNTTT